MGSSEAESILGKTLDLQTARKNMASIQWLWQVPRILQLEMINWLHTWPEKRKRSGTYSYYTFPFSIHFSYLILTSNFSLSCCTWNSIYNHGLLSFVLLIIVQCFLQVFSPLLLSSFFFNFLSDPLLFIKSTVPPPFADALRGMSFLDLLVCARRSFSTLLLSHG